LEASNHHMQTNLECFADIQVTTILHTISLLRLEFNLSGGIQHVVGIVKIKLCS